MQEIGRKILRACALEYGGNPAPVVRWYAEGEAAQKLLELARRHNIPVEEGQAEELLLALKSVPLDRAIPPELYLAVARIYAYLLQRVHDPGGGK